MHFTTEKKKLKNPIVNEIKNINNIHVRKTFIKYKIHGFTNSKKSFL